MLDLYVYKAGKGDCIRLRFADTHNIFIDTGVMSFGNKFKNLCDDILSAGETLDALILTHVDDDHIGGILSNLRKKHYHCPFMEVWMNSDGMIPSADRKLSVTQNDEVYSKLVEQNISVIPMKKGDVKSIAEATIKTIWPEDVKRSQAMTPGDTTLSRKSDYRFALSVLADTCITKNDTSINNKNSIVFTFSYDEHELLFTGDAWAEDVVKAVGVYDLVKLPHHGSVRNISEMYKSTIRANNFLICTDGVSHPDKQTIAKLEKWYGEVNIYSPSDWWSEGYYINDDESHKINYYKKEGLVLAW